MEKSEIISAIEKRVKSTESKKYSIWTIGVTDDPTTRKTQHENPKHWMQWNADNESDARAIEKHFLDKKMKGGEGGGGTADYVYIF